MAEQAVDAALAAAVGLLTAEQAGLDAPGLLVDVDVTTVARFLAAITTAVLEAATSDGGAAVLEATGLQAARGRYLTTPELENSMPDLALKTAEDRALALRRHRDEASAAAAAVRAQVTQLEGQAHDLLVAGDVVAARAAQARAAALRPQLTTAEASLDGLERAVMAVAAEAVTEQHRAGLAAAQTEHAAALAEATDHAAGLEADLQALTDRLASARAAEARSRAAYAQAHEYKVALGEAEHARYAPSGPTPVTVLTQGHPLWQIIGNLPGSPA